jgi:hypothetical protein
MRDAEPWPALEKRLAVGGKAQRTNVERPATQTGDAIRQQLEREQARRARRIVPPLQLQPARVRQSREQVAFTPDGLTSTGWESYPVLRFSEVPRVRVHVLDRPDQPSLGAGEAAQGPVAAAIANAVADALGVRVRSLPLTPDKLLQAVHAAGGA